jgi:hypothetical protein
MKRTIPVLHESACANPRTLRRHAKVDFDKKTASISFDPDKANPDALTKSTADSGYPSAVHN